MFRTKNLKLRLGDKVILYSRFNTVFITEHSINNITSTIPYSTINTVFKSEYRIIHIHYIHSLTRYN